MRSDNERQVNLHSGTRRRDRPGRYTDPHAADAIFKARKRGRYDAKSWWPRYFKEEELLKPDMVTVTRMARSAVPPNAFSSYADVQDRWVKNVMLEGDLLVEKKLGPKGTPPGLVANIPQGMRAFAIDVTEQSGVSGSHSARASCRRDPARD